MLDIYIATTLGVAAASLSCIGFAPYILDCFRGRTVPQRASWLIWSVLSAIALATQIAEGAGASIAFVATQCAGTVTIFLLSIFRGRGRIGPQDWVVLGGASIGLLAWFAASNAAYALIITIVISLLGGALTVVKAYNDPHSETPSTWVAFLLSSALAVASVGAWEPMYLAYPAYLMALYLAIVIAIALGERRFAGFKGASPGAITGRSQFHAMTPDTAQTGIQHR